MKSYDDPIKQQSREKLRDFIRKHVLCARTPSKVKILCFPGAEQEGQEAIEVKEVYDPLGIPRENIVGLEFNIERGDRLRRANLGIEVVSEKDVDYLASTGDFFDVISLDYTGTKSFDVGKALAKIASRQILKPLGVVAINNCAKRENKMTQNYLASRRMTNNLTQEFAEVVIKDSQVDWAKTFSAIPVSKIPSLEESRDDFTKVMVITMASGKNAEYRGWATRIYLGEKVDRIVYPNLDLSDPTKWEGHNRMRVMMADKVNKPPVRVIGADGSSCADSNMLAQFIALISPVMDQAYMLKDLERYRYVSNSGTPMDLDLGCFIRPDHLYNKLRCCFSINENNGVTTIRCIPQLGRDFRSGLNALLEKNTPSARYIKDAGIERIFLGSSTSCDTQVGSNMIEGEMVQQQGSSNDGSNVTGDGLFVGSSRLKAPVIPDDRREPISKADALTLLASGCSPAEIFESYSGFSKGQLRAIKAHITMGTYTNK